MDLLLGPDVHADGRLVDDQDVAIRGQPFGQADFLLVASAQVLGPLLRPRGPDVEIADEAPDEGRLPGAGNPVRDAAGEPRPDRDRDVGPDGRGQPEPFLFPILGDVGHPVALEGVGDAPDAGPLAADEHRAGIHAVGADEDAGELGPARAHEPVEAQNLAFAQAEARVLDPADARHALGAQHLASFRGAPPPRPGPAEIAADHHPDELRRGEAGRRPRADEHPIAQDADLVGQGQDLLDLVRDEEDRHALFPKAAQDIEKGGRFALRERARRFVQ